MTEAEKRSAAKEFATYWKGKGYEKGESQKYWLSLLTKVYGVKDPEQFIFFEDQVVLDHTSFIDGSIPATHVLANEYLNRIGGRHETTIIGNTHIVHAFMPLCNGRKVYSGGIAVCRNSGIPRLVYLAD